jgi:hypothetical protein
MAFHALAQKISAGAIVWAIVFGFVAGAFMGLPTAGVVSICNFGNTIGARLGMILGSVRCGVLVAEPIAGAILGRPRGGWLCLVSWSGALMLTGFMLLFTARISKVGCGLRLVV